jgi:threonine aldolase
MPAPPDTLAALADTALRLQCTTFLSGHRPRRSMREALDEMARVPEAALALDTYGAGELVQRLEAELAALLGKEAAVFFHKGVAAQLAALRVWAGAEREAVVALHPQSHIACDEANAFERLMGLRGARLGAHDRPFGVAELDAAGERPAVVTIELPLRNAGFRLPAWEDLEALRRWTAERGIPFHLDGARLWEACPHYGVEPARLAALADSVYVSFYKGLGGLGGCVLAGSSDFIAQVRPWQQRLAGNLWTAFPYVLSAQDGLRRHLPRMGEYRERARSLAAALSASLRAEGVVVAPEPPQVNAFQVHLPGDPARVTQAMKDLAARERFWLAGRCIASTRPGLSMFEVAIGDASEDWDEAQAVAHVAAVVRAARG